MNAALTLISLNIFSFALNAHADYSLANSGKKVACYSDDNYSYEMNAARTKIKFTVEGETQGPKKIINVKTDNATYISYTTSEGTLTLSNQGDMWQFSSDEEAYEIKCK